MLVKPTQSDLDTYLKILERHRYGFKTKIGHHHTGWDKGTPEANEINRMAEYALFRTYNDTDQRYESQLTTK